jgi:hypothetical protein
LTIEAIKQQLLTQHKVSVALNGWLQQTYWLYYLSLAIISITIGVIMRCSSHLMRFVSTQFMIFFD